MENDTVKGFALFDVRSTQHKKKSQSETKRRVSKSKNTKRKRDPCTPDCPCKRIAAVNSRLDSLLFDIRKINSKAYMDDYMKALDLQHTLYKEKETDQYCERKTSDTSI